MKISDVQAIYPRYNHPAKTWRTHFWQIVVRVETDVGVVGWGYGGGGVGSVEVVNRHFRELLVGQSFNSAEEIATLWDALYRACLPYGRGGIAIMALSGVDLALWDALGKAEGKRVCDLLGGQRRAKVRAYATGQDAERYRDLGFDAHKSTQLRDGERAEDMEQLLSWAERARTLFGPQALLMVDAYMSWEADYAEEVAQAVTPCDLFWIEDVLQPDDIEGASALRKRVQPLKVVGGEHEFTVHAFKHIARAQALDMWQPDITWCGGLTEALRIARLADAEGIPVCPHRGGEVWGAHFLAAGYGEDLAECHMGNFAVKQHALWLGEPQPIEGFIELGEGLGFGVEVNEAML